MTRITLIDADVVRLPYDEIVGFVGEVFRILGIPDKRAATSAEALCYGELTGMTTHGLVNLTRIYLRLFESGRIDPHAEPLITSDAGAAVHLDAGRALGLWMAAEAMDLAAERAEQFGIGMVSVRNSTHVGCTGFHASRAVERQMIGLVLSNCGRQRIARPPGGKLAMLGTNPLALAAPAGSQHPFVLDMSTTVVPTGRIRAAARGCERIPVGWLEDDRGNPVTDAAAFDRGEARLRWLGGDPATGAYKGYGLGLLVEVLGALLPGAGLGPEPDSMKGDGNPSGRDDDIGFLALAIDPGKLRPAAAFLADADTLFRTLCACPPADGVTGVRYPGWHEAERAAANRRFGVAVPLWLCEELRHVGDDLGLEFSISMGGPA